MYSHLIIHLPKEYQRLLTSTLIIMRFDTTHEYYLQDASLYYCKEHNSLIVHNNEGLTDNRLVLSGITSESIDNLIKSYQVKKVTTKKT